MHRWRPILPPDLMDEAAAVVAAIARELLDGKDSEGSVASVAGGLAGMAVTYAYLAESGLQAELARTFRERAARCLDEAIEVVSSTGPIPPSLFGGFLGVAWAAEHVGRMLELDHQDVNDDVDAALSCLVESGVWTADYDLIQGLVGFGVYAVERLPHPGAARLLEKIVHRLAERSITTSSGLTWFTPPALLPEVQRESFPQGYYNLGVAHGVPGVLALLGQCYALGIARDTAAALITGGSAWVHAQEQPPGALSRFAGMVAAGRVAAAPEPTRLAWCYGDLGLSAALLGAGVAVGDSQLRSWAMETARFASHRTRDDAGIKDAALCHGAVGIAHVFNRLHQATMEPTFLEAARAWFAHGLQLRKEGTGLAGFLSWYPRTSEEDSPWKPIAGLLEGVAGIALGLMGAASAAEPNWDRLLLVSLPPGSAAD